MRRPGKCRITGFLLLALTVVVTNTLCPAFNDTWSPLEVLHICNWGFSPHGDKVKVVQDTPLHGPICKSPPAFKKWGSHWIWWTSKGEIRGVVASHPDFLLAFPFQKASTCRLAVVTGIANPLKKPANLQRKVWVGGLGRKCSILAYMQGAQHGQSYVSQRGFSPECLRVSAGKKP